MDGQRFDALTRRLATGTSRRGVLRGLTAGAAAAVAAALGREAQAFPNRCAIVCNQPYFGGPLRAACRQTCQRAIRECGSLEEACVDFATGEVACCPTQNCCYTERGLQCCGEGTQCCFDPDTGVTCAAQCPSPE